MSTITENFKNKLQNKERKYNSRIPSEENTQIKKQMNSNRSLKMGEMKRKQW